MHRRSFLQWSIAAAAFGAVGIPRRAHGQTQPGQADAAADTLVDTLAHEPMSLHLLDLLGTLNFADAMGGIAVQGDSIIQTLLVKASLGGPSEQVDVEGHHQQHVFPLANFIFAAVLNAVRATAFGPQTSSSTTSSS